MIGTHKFPSEDARDRCYEHLRINDGDVMTPELERGIEQFIEDEWVRAAGNFNG
jgi:hypothetical protein